MSKISLDNVTAKEFFSLIAKEPERLPVRFTYDGKEFYGLPGASYTSAEAKAPLYRGSLELPLWKGLTARAELLFNAEFGELEYTLFFENRGTEASGLLEDVYCLDRAFEGADPMIRSCLGDHENYYEAYEHDLRKGDRHFRSEEGRATHIVFPYFDLVHGDGGTMFAIGWAGTWDALFIAHDGRTEVRVKSDVNLSAVLLPGESVRTALIVLLPYQGRSYDHATNLWREWYMKYNLPKANAAGESLKPFTSACWASDTGLPNSDGSISERSFTWQHTLDKLKAEKFLPDFRWFDAGWYFDPKGQTVESDWWGTIGTWELDTVKWPGKTFLESNEACHEVGMKVLCWFEPERVTDPESLEKNYGYKKEWGIRNGNVITNNIGDEECLKWTLQRITKMLSENGIDMYREDNNSDPGFSWRFLDAHETEKYGVPRQGMGENKCIVGHYKLWDGIIEFCRENGKCTFVDSCASGGGRNDIESMRRGFPMMRSDYDRTTSAMRLSQSSSFCRWIPFHGSCMKETKNQLDASSGAGSDAYVSRASYLPVANYTESYTQNPDLDYDLLRRFYEEWKSINTLLMKDFYVLTPWHHHLDRFGFTAFSYDDPEEKRAVLLLFRQEECEQENFTAKLPFAVSGKTYTLTDRDSGEVVKYDGSALLQGISLKVREKKMSRMLDIRYE